MNTSLQFHRASAGEQAQAFENLHDVWGRGLSADEHLRWRLSYAKHRNAQWYVGRLAGRVVTACGCYRMEVRIDGKTEPACALGEVHTLAEFRGQGLAPRLIAFVEDEQRADGRTMSLLYSDISTSYYERLGYVSCACFEGWIDPRQRRESWERSTDPLVPFDAAAEREDLASIYEDYHAALPFSIARSRDYWSYLIARDPEDEFLWLCGASGGRLGYVRLACAPAEIKIRDWSLVAGDDLLRRRLFLAVLKHAASRRVARVGGWMPASETERGLFDVSERTRELTMLKPLQARQAITSRHRTAAEHLHEMDHV